MITKYLSVNIRIQFCHSCFISFSSFCLSGQQTDLKTFIPFLSSSHLRPLSKFSLKISSNKITIAKLITLRSSGQIKARISHTIFSFRFNCFLTISFNSFTGLTLCGPLCKVWSLKLKKCSLVTHKQISSVIQIPIIYLLGNTEKRK